MPCRDTLQPAVGCRGPGGDNICDYCWEIEKKDSGGIAKRPRPGAKPVAVQPTAVKTTPVSTGKPPVPPRKVDAQPSPPTGGVKVMPSPPVALRKPMPVPPMRPGQVTALVDKPVTN